MKWTPKALVSIDNAGLKIDGKQILHIEERIIDKTLLRCKQQYALIRICVYSLGFAYKIEVYAPESKQYAIHWNYIDTMLLQGMEMTTNHNGVILHKRPLQLIHYKLMKKNQQKMEKRMQKYEKRQFQSVLTQAHGNEIPKMY